MSPKDDKCKRFFKIKASPELSPMDGFGGFAFFLNSMEFAAGRSDTSSGLFITWPCIIFCMNLGAISLFPPSAIKTT